MRLILISADLGDIRRSYALGVFVGVASNPTLVAEGKRLAAIDPAVDAAARSFHADYTARFGEAA